MTTVNDDDPVPWEFDRSQSQTVGGGFASSRGGGDDGGTTPTNRRAGGISPGGGGRGYSSGKRKVPFTQGEKDAISSGVDDFGPGQWRQIREGYIDLLSNRTTVQIKDCYRTMLRRGEIGPEVGAEALRMAAERKARGDATSARHCRQRGLNLDADAGAASGTGVNAIVDANPPPTSTTAAAAVAAATPPSSARRHRRFTSAEKNAIKAGIAKLGRGNWEMIREEYWDELQDRTGVQIKDCHRTMLKHGEVEDELGYDDEDEEDEDENEDEDEDIGIDVQLEEEGHVELEERGGGSGRRRGTRRILGGRRFMGDAKAAGRRNRARRRRRKKNGAMSSPRDEQRGSDERADEDDGKAKDEHEDEDHYEHEDVDDDLSVQTGTKICKTFEGQGTFVGEVTFTPTTGMVPFFGVHYEDGDAEEMSEDEVRDCRAQYLTKRRRETRGDEGETATSTRKKKKVSAGDDSDKKMEDATTHKEARDAARAAAAEAKRVEAAETKRLAEEGKSRTAKEKRAARAAVAGEKRVEAKDSERLAEEEDVRRVERRRAARAAVAKAKRVRAEEAAAIAGTEEEAIAEEVSEYESSDIANYSDEEGYYLWANLWPRLQRKGWTAVKAGKRHPLLDWLYVRPGCHPKDPKRKLDIHYFGSAEGVVSYQKKLDQGGKGGGAR